MSFHPDQFRSLIERTLQKINLFSPDAVELQMLTAAHESHLGTYIRQVGGPAIGVFQCEPPTHRDHWRYLNIKKETDPEFFSLISSIMGNGPDLFRLESDLAYQIVDARIHYYMIPEPLPFRGAVLKMAEYWDKHWNRNPDKGFPEQAAEDYLRYAFK